MVPRGYLPPRITEHGAGNQRNYSRNQVKEANSQNMTARGGLPTPPELRNTGPRGVPSTTYPLGIAERRHPNLPSLAKEHNPVHGTPWRAKVAHSMCEICAFLSDPAAACRALTTIRCKNLTVRLRSARRDATISFILAARTGRRSAQREGRPWYPQRAERAAHCGAVPTARRIIFCKI
jgi:hypothetical protein